MIKSGTTCSFSNPSAQSPRMNPNRLKLTAVNTRNAIIHTGWAIRSGISSPDVTSTTSPRMMDLVAAAPTYPMTISR